MQPFFEGLRKRRLLGSLYQMFFISRRIIIVLLIIFMNRYNSLQLIGFLGLSITNFMYLVGVRPFLYKQDNRMEIQNEGFIYFSIMLMFCLLNAATS